MTHANNNWSRRGFLRRASLGALAVAGRLAAEPAPARRKPNILLIIADDATYSDLPLYGGQNVKTPNIDRLAK